MRRNAQLAKVPIPVRRPASPVWTSRPGTSTEVCGRWRSVAAPTRATKVMITSYRGSCICYAVRVVEFGQISVGFVICGLRDCHSEVHEPGKVQLRSDGDGVGGTVSVFGDD